MPAKIKICGLKRAEDIEYVNEYRPEYAGFVFFPPSSRYVTLEEAKALSGRLSPDIIPVGVFLDNTLEEILEVEKSGAVKVLQIHGKDAPLLVRKLKEISSLPVWEAVTVKSKADVERARESAADMVLLDNGPGGTGEKFDWSLLRDIGRDFFLAGGLNKENVREALKCRPYGVDTSSGVETDRLKDRDKIRDFIYTVRSYTD